MSVGNVCPCLPVQDCANTGLTDSVFRRQGALRYSAVRKSASDVSHICLSQFGLVQGFASSYEFRSQPPRVSIASQRTLRVQAEAVAVTASRPAFRGGISVVVCFRPHEQVGRAYATDVAPITAMEDARRFGRWFMSDRQDVRNNVGTARATIDIDLPIPLVARAGPYPTGTEVGAMGRDRSVLIDFWPEPISQRTARILSGHRLSPSGGVAPRAVSAAPGYSRCPNFTTYDQIGVS